MTTAVRPSLGVRLSCRLYALLVSLYPARFRRDYGPLLQQAFADTLRDAARASAHGLLGVWLMALADLLPSLGREYLDHIREDRIVALNRRTVLAVYFWLYAAFAALVSVGTALDLTHAGDVGNVVVALGATFGLFAAVFGRPILAPTFWRALFGLIVVYDLAVVTLVLATQSEPLGFHWLLGSTALASKAYDLAAIAVSGPALWMMGRLGGWGQDVLPRRSVSG